MNLKNTKAPYLVVLYYNYVQIQDPKTTVYEHLAFCKALGLLGRIYMANEGINGTCAGTPDQVKKYLKYMRQHPLFKDTEFKIEESDFLPFRKMFVRTRPEIVASDLFGDVNPKTDGGKHLSPKDFHEMAKNDPDAVLFDGRNLYEARIGTFEGAITPAVENFRELKDMVHDFDDLKDKKVMMFCTGGIRCEKASGLLKKEGFKNVYQLHGGIIKYKQEIPKEESLFKGKCFVFDDRIATPVTDDVISNCDHCGVSCDRYLNCTNAECNKLYICCDSCKESMEHACSEECAKNPRKSWKRADVMVG